MGGKIDHSVNQGRGPYTFRIGGENTHLVGSLLPNNDAPPKFCQLYIYDTEEELKHRKNALSSTNGIQFDDGLMKDLKEMVDRYNVLAKSFRMGRDRLHQGADGEVRLRLISARNTDERTYNLPTVSEVAALIVGDMKNTVDSRDIVVEERSGRLQRISELHASYLALQYPIIFPRGEDGHRLGIPHSQHSITSSSRIENARDKLTFREWFAFLIQDRSSAKEYPTILMAGKLFQQFLADGCTMIESDRLKYIRFNQPKLWSESFKNLENAAAIGQTNPFSAGVHFIVPSSFKGSKGFMRETYQDTMTICRCCGYPDLFITVICNPKWPEITRADKFPEAVDVDRVISAEIPDPLENPALYAAVKDCMIHGPCGELNPDAPCMIYGICSKKFPKRFNKRTTVDGDGYPVYKRRENGTTIEKNGKTIHNGYVVPYNADLLLKYRAHFNVEWCNQARSIKYLFKYINKGYDHVTVVKTQIKLIKYKNTTTAVTFHHVKQFGIFLSFLFTIGPPPPHVLRLDYHLPNEQNVIFHDDDPIDEVVERSSEGRTKFTAWMEYNNLKSGGRDLTYCEFPQKFVWERKGYGNQGKKDLLLAECIICLQMVVRDLQLIDVQLLLVDKLSYDKDALKKEHEVLTSSTTDEQKSIYRKIMYSVENGQGGVYLVYGYGGTGKTFLWKTLCVGIRSKGEIVIDVTSSGIAAILFPGGRTAHARLSIPINVDENSTCHGIQPGADLVELLKREKLIIWDEAPMANRYCFEALDRSLRDIMRTSPEGDPEKPFGGKVVVFGSDFRQILPVIPKGSRQDIVGVAISSSPLWRYCKVLKLTKNMRHQVGSAESDIDEIKQFSEWILEVGDGLAGGPNDGVANIELAEDILIQPALDPIATIIDSTYPSLKDHLGDPWYFTERVVLAPTHDVVEVVNDYVLDEIQKDEKVYLSSDEISKEETNCGVRELYSTEFLNSIRCSGLPNHSLKLKVRAIVMLLRNIDQENGLCNGTRMEVNHLGNRVISAIVASRSHVGSKVYIPRITLTPSDTTMFPVKLERRQFPLAVCFAMTINKSQGQSLSRVGLYLPRPVFTHGQFQNPIKDEFEEFQVHTILFLRQLLAISTMGSTQTFQQEIKITAIRAYKSMMAVKGDFDLPVGETHSRIRLMETAFIENKNT
ncbi:uncharacterized protein LOC141618623 [Silene latifolia]|uniref:uncharacterized protein LOC141618623 n=1 Tax=Silene latifolia TaxID=37657 RepID=UPI003D76AD5F